MAAASGHAQTDDEDKCSICLSRFVDARYLPCGNLHVVCLRPCLEDLVQHNQQKGSFLCPLCRGNVAIPRGGAAAFQQVSADLAPSVSSPSRQPSVDLHPARGRPRSAKPVLVLLLPSARRGLVNDLRRARRTESAAAADSAVFVPSLPPPHTRGEQVTALGSARRSGRSSPATPVPSLWPPFTRERVGDLQTSPRQESSAAVPAPISLLPSSSGRQEQVTDLRAGSAPWPRPRRPAQGNVDLWTD